MGKPYVLLWHASFPTRHISNKTITCYDVLKFYFNGHLRECLARRASVEKGIKGGIRRMSRERKEGRKKERWAAWHKKSWVNEDHCGFQRSAGSNKKGPIANPTRIKKEYVKGWVDLPLQLHCLHLPHLNTRRCKNHLHFYLSKQIFYPIDWFFGDVFRILHINKV